MAYINTNLSELTTIVRMSIDAALIADEIPQPIIILGPPGGGKTQWAIDPTNPTGLPATYAKALGIDPLDLGIVIEKIARRDAADLAGIPLPAEGPDGSMHTENTKSPVIIEIERTGRDFGILVLDEAAQGNASQQKVLADCFDPNEHKLGSFDLPKGWIVVGTGNRATDKSGAMKLLSHLTNRAMVANIEHDAAGWRENYAEPKGINPVMVDCAMAHAENGFWVDAVPPEDGPYCTPRSTVAAARHLDGFMASSEYTGGAIPSVVEKMLAMNIGSDKAALVAQWTAESGNVPTPSEIFTDPEGAILPDQTGFQQVAAVRAMGSMSNAREAQAVLHYLVRLRRDLQVSLGVKLMNIVVDKGWTTTDPLYAAFISEFNEYLPLTWED